MTPKQDTGSQKLGVNNSPYREDISAPNLQQNTIKNHLNQNVDINGINSPGGFASKQDTGEVSECCTMCDRKILNKVEDWYCDNPECGCHETQSMTEVMGNVEAGKGYCTKCGLETSPTMLCKCSGRTKDGNWEAPNTKAIFSGATNGEYEPLVEGAIPLTQEIIDEEVMPYVEAPNTEAYPLMEADSEGTMRHKCCEHCEENGHAPHSRGCPNTEASLEEELEIYCFKYAVVLPEQIKSFIISLIHTEREKAREEVIELILPYAKRAASEEKMINPDWLVTELVAARKKPSV